MASRNRKTRKPDTAPRPKLAPEQFPELNATFYAADPAEYILLRIEALSLMLCTDEELATAFGSTRRLGVTAVPASEPPNADMRRRYLNTESVVLFHHAAETLLRMYIAHVEHAECPWFGIASSTRPLEFKEKIETYLQDGFVRDDVAVVFHGGRSPRDAAVRVSDEEFEASIEAITDLLGFCAQRLLIESFIYNSAKHGLSTVQLDGSTRMTILGEDEKPIPLQQGEAHVYLHRQRRSGEKNDREWFVSATGVLPDQDIAMANLIHRALSSLWDVAKRRYVGESGSITIFTPEEVLMAVNAPVMASGSMIRTTTYELSKKDENGALSKITILMSQHPIDEEWWERQRGVDRFQPSTLRRVKLVKRQRDLQPFTTSRNALLPFSPKGSSRV